MRFEDAEGGSTCMNESRISDEIVKSEFVQREYGIAHPTYDVELQFYQLVSGGEVEILKTTLGEPDETVLAARGSLSGDDLRNRRYHEIVMVAMISRFCIEEGMDEMESYNLSDYYIRQLDMANTRKQLAGLHDRIVMDYAERMRKIKKKTSLSVYSMKAMDYVYDHLHEKIKIGEIADSVGVSRSHLSRLFNEETGITLSEYIMQKKLQTARNMMVYSEFTCAEISEYLAFASGSYFAKCFKEHYGISPYQYRKENYRKHFIRGGHDG